MQASQQSIKMLVLLADVNNLLYGLLYKSYNWVLCVPIVVAFYDSRLLLCTLNCF